MKAAANSGCLFVARAGQALFFSGEFDQEI
jgi:hypothetical protein